MQKTKQKPGTKLKLDIKVLNKASMKPLLLAFLNLNQIENMTSKKKNSKCKMIKDDVNISSYLQDLFDDNSLAAV